MFKHQKNLAYSMVEMMVALAIIAGLVVIGITTMAGLKEKESVDIAAQSIMNDLIQIRSKALTTNQAYRIAFTSVSNWKLQRNNVGTWVDESDVRTMPSSTFLTSASFANAGVNLEATARGLYAFSGSATGTPYVTITGTGVTQTRSVYVYVGGAIEKQTP